MDPEFFDVVIVGAGLSGIGAAWHLKNKCPNKRYLILESRNTLGGTWDLFRYPGIPSVHNRLRGIFTLFLQGISGYWLAKIRVTCGYAFIIRFSFSITS
jgi:thioredoxin reductase